MWGSSSRSFSGRFFKRLVANVHVQTEKCITSHLYLLWSLKCYNIIIFCSPFLREKRALREVRDLWEQAEDKRLCR